MEKLIYHLLLKIFKTTVKTVEENKNVLSVLLGITFLKEQEVFKKDYLNEYDLQDKSI